MSAYEIKTSEIHQKKKRKIPIDTNQLFASIETIKAVQDEQQRCQEEWDRKDRAKEARHTANEMEVDGMSQLQHEFHINTIAWDRNTDIDIVEDTHAHWHKWCLTQIVVGPNSGRPKWKLAQMAVGPLSNISYQ